MSGQVRLNLNGDVNGSVFTPPNRETDIKDLSGNAYINLELHNLSKFIRC